MHFDPPITLKGVQISRFPEPTKSRFAKPHTIANPLGNIVSCLQTADPLC